MSDRTEVENTRAASGDGSKYTPEELEYMRACADYLRRERKRYLTLVDHLRIAHSLGYRKVREEEK